jgi:predicted amidohydrolase YtcJ
MHPSRSILALAFLAAVPAGAQQPAEPRADLIVTGATIHTADSARPVAQALAVRGGRVLYVGTADSAMRWRGPRTRVVVARGRTVIPGMTDAHAHLLGLGNSLRNVDLVGTKSYDEVIARVVRRARELPKGAWILGRGWDQNDWRDQRFPTHEALSRALPDHPVALERVDGHATLANAAAMRAAKVTRESRDPDGGRIERDAGGEPTGVFVDNAAALIDSAVPDLTAAERRDAVLRAVKEVNRWGLTGMGDAGADRETIETYEALAKEGRFTLRNYVMVSDDSASLAHYFARGPQSGTYDGLLWVRSVKLYADGALGSRGAALLAPYADDTTHRGLLVSTPEHLERRTVEALRAGFQVATHAIGDRGNRVVLDAYERALKAAPTEDPRLRIEHAQVIALEDIPRFRALGVIPSMQGSHQTSDMYWAEQRVGPARIRGAYAWRKLLDSGAIIPNGSDFPVEFVNPLISFHAAVTRQDAENRPPGGWYPEERMTRGEALKSMTLWPAMAQFQERELGSLTPGKRADFVILDQDIMTVAPERILDTKVVSTWLGGRAVYEASAATNPKAAAR